MRAEDVALFPMGTVIDLGRYYPVRIWRATSSFFMVMLPALTF